MKQEQVEIKSVNVYTHIFWKDNLMKINQQTLHAILNRLLKYYAVKFHVNRDLSNERYTSTLKLNDSLDKVLKSLSFSTVFSYVWDGDDIYIIF